MNTCIRIDASDRLLVVMFIIVKFNQSFILIKKNGPMLNRVGNHLSIFRKRNISLAEKINPFVLSLSKYERTYLFSSDTLPLSRRTSWRLYACVQPMICITADKASSRVTHFCNHVPPNCALRYNLRILRYGIGAIHLSRLSV